MSAESHHLAWAILLGFRDRLRVRFGEDIILQAGERYEGYRIGA
jgi:hypothetical protein